MDRKFTKAQQNYLFIYPSMFHSNDFDFIVGVKFTIIELKKKIRFGQYHSEFRNTLREMDKTSPNRKPKVL